MKQGMPVRLAAKAGVGPGDKVEDNNYVYVVDEVLADGSLKARAVELKITQTVFPQ